MTDVTTSTALTELAAGTYVIENGTYYIVAGQDAHDAVNNILAARRPG